MRAHLGLANAQVEREALARASGKQPAIAAGGQHRIPIAAQAGAGRLRRSGRQRGLRAWSRGRAKAHRSGATGVSGKGDEQHPQQRGQHRRRHWLSVIACARLAFRVLVVLAPLVPWSCKRAPALSTPYFPRPKALLGAPVGLFQALQSLQCALQHTAAGRWWYDALCMTRASSQQQDVLAAPCPIAQEGFSAAKASSPSAGVAFTQPG